jgi:hypothetical protein
VLLRESHVRECEVGCGDGGFLLKGDDMVANLDVGDALTNRLDDASTLMSENDRESTLWILTRQGVGILLGVSTIRKRWKLLRTRTSVADTSVVNLDADLVGTRRKDFNVLNAKGLAGLPGDSGLAVNDLFKMVNKVLQKMTSTTGGVRPFAEG